MTDLVVDALGQPQIGDVAEIDLRELADALDGTRFAEIDAEPTDDDLFSDLFERVGLELARGSGTILPRIIEPLSLEGELAPICAIVFPRLPDDLSADEQRDARIATQAIVKGIEQVKISNVFGDPIDLPVVGADLPGTSPARFRPASALAPAVDAASPLSAATIGILALLAIGGGLAVGTAVRRTVTLRRPEA